MSLPTDKARHKATTRESVLQVAGTFAAFLALTAASYRAMASSIPLGLLLAVPAGLLVVRLFIVQHDCAHRAYFKSSRANDLLGAALGVVTLVPHDYWRDMHIHHHASSGNLSRRGQGDIHTLTLAEYNALSPKKRLAYRIFRHPATMLLAGPIAQFFIRFRLPALVMEAGRRGAKARRSVAITNLGMLAVYGLFFSFGDTLRWLIVHLAIVQVSAGAGIFLFYVQHQVEEPYWVPGGSWSARAAALEGSSHLLLPRWLEWLVGAINLHHVHHLRPDVPNYRMRSFMMENGLEEEGAIMTLSEAIATFNLKLYDETSRTMVGFPKAQSTERTLARA